MTADGYMTLREVIEEFGESHGVTPGKIHNWILTVGVPVKRFRSERTRGQKARFIRRSDAEWIARMIGHDVVPGDYLQHGEGIALEMAEQRGVGRPVDDCVMCGKWPPDEDRVLCARCRVDAYLKRERVVSR